MRDNARAVASVALAALILVSTVVGALPLASVGAAAASSSQGGMVGLADDQISSNVPQHAQDRIPTSAGAWSPQTSAYSSSLQMEISTESARKGMAPSRVKKSTDDLVLSFTDDQNHEGRKVGVNATTLEETVGYRPEFAYGVHEDGSEWRESITYEDGMAVWTIPRFSTNTVTFDGEFSLTATPASDGDQFSWNTSDGGENLVINVTGATNSAWDNESAVGIAPSGKTSIAVGGNAPASSETLTLTGYGTQTLYSGSVEVKRWVAGDNSGELVDSEMQINKPPSTIEKLKFGIGGEGGDNDIDIYIVKEQPDGTYGEGTKVKSGWTPNTTGNITVDITDYDASGASSVTVELITNSAASSDSYLKTKNGGQETDSFSEDTSGSATFRNDPAAVYAIASPPQSVGVTVDGTTFSFGNFSDGETKSKQIDFSSSASELNFSGSGTGSLYVDLDLKERTQTVDPVVELNGNSESHTGTLSDGQTVTITQNDSHLVAGENQLNVSVGDGTLSSDAPTPQANVNVTHDVVTTQSIDFKSEALSEEYTANKTWDDGGNNAQFSVTWASNRVVKVRDLEVQYYDSNGNLDHTDTSPTYSVSGDSVTVELGDVPQGWTTRVVLTGSKVQVKNGNITVLDATKSGNTLDTKIQIDSKSQGFAIEVGGTAEGDLIHYTMNESYSGPDEYSVTKANGKQLIKMPNAGSGSTARIRTIPVEAHPKSGEVHISVADGPSSTEPQFQVRGPGNGYTVDYRFLEAQPETKYNLESVTHGIVRDSGTANSPITLTDDDSSETLGFFVEDSGSSTSDGDSGDQVIQVPGQFQQESGGLSLRELALVGVPLLGLAGAVVLYRRRESGAGTSSTGASGAAVSLIARAGGAFTNLVRVLSDQPRVLIALGILGGIGAIATGLIQLPPGTGILLVVTGIPLLTYFAMERLSGEFRPVVFGTVSVVAIVLGLQLLGADPIGQLLDSLGPGVLILALGLIWLGYEALQAAKAPDEVNKITIGDGDS